MPGPPTVLQSEIIFYDPNVTLVDAKIRLDTGILSSTDDFLWYLSPDGGTTWEEASINQTHTFTATGNDLRLQILGSSGAEIDLSVKRIEVFYRYE